MPNFKSMVPGIKFNELPTAGTNPHESLTLILRFNI